MDYDPPTDTKKNIMKQSREMAAAKKSICKSWADGSRGSVVAAVLVSCSAGQASFG